MDPVTGETLWVSRDLAPESAVFGDRQYVFLVPPGSGEATVLRATDGKVLGTRDVPLEGDRLATFGRRILAWSGTDSHRLLEMIDPWSGGAVWPSLEFKADAQLDLLRDEGRVAVFEPDGRFVLIDVADGRKVIDAKVEAESLLSGIHVLASPDGYLLVVEGVDRESDGDPNRQVHPVHATKSIKIERGRVYAFDRQGHVRWEAPRSIEDQYLPLDQPCRLPTLTFASVVRKRDDRGRFETGISILSIDKRTGRTILDQTFDGPTNSFRLTGDPQRKTVQVELQKKLVTLAFTDEPEPEPTEAEATAGGADTQPTPNTARALWNSVRKAAIGSLPVEPVNKTAERKTAAPGAADESQPIGSD